MMQRNMELTIPWPARNLHPNARVHWAVLAKAKKQARSMGFMYARAAGWIGAPIPKEGPIQVWIDGYPKDRRRRDADGLLSALKPWLDGIADALGVDDSRFKPHPDIKTEIRKGGQVHIRLTFGALNHVESKLAA